jgi:hypothetical protein
MGLEEEIESLEEYTRTFPDYRINSAVEIEFDTDGQTISNPSATMTDPGDSNTPGDISPVTLEGASDEPENPLRTTYDYDGSQNFLKAIVKGSHTAQEKVGPIGESGIEGYRASIILGGSDPYLENLKGDIDSLAVLTGQSLPGLIRIFFIHIATFYSFLDFVYMADGTTLARVWDASVYPAHALYVGGDKEDQNVFREDIEWTTQGPPEAHPAFNQFGVDANSIGHTPFDQFGSWRYKSNFTNGFGPHPVMVYAGNGTSLQASTVENELPSPLFPSSLAPL